MENNGLTLAMVDAEISMLRNNYFLLVDQLRRDAHDELVKQDSARPLSHHFGHNAGTAASQLQMLAGQIEQMQRVRASFTA